jgi:acyl dehydratase
VRYFEDFETITVRTAPGRYEVTEDEIVEMGTRWDPQPFHVDAEAAKDSIFGGLVASSVHLFAIAVRLGSTYPGKVAAVTALGFKQLQWHSPARTGDLLRLRSTTLSTRRSRSRPDCGIVESRSEVLNQNDDLGFSYEGAALIRRQPDGAS